MPQVEKLAAGRWGFGGYHGLGDFFDKQVVPNHTKNISKIGEYFTSTIEEFWSMFKQAIVGQYHKITREHLQEYINEMTFKYNYRNNNNRFDILISKCLNRTSAFSQEMTLKGLCVNQNLYFNGYF